ncbi:O-acyltransferase WSD1, partial [Trifolium pratense]
GYSVRGAYQLLTSHDLVTMDVADNLIWHSHVPLKVSIFAWRLLRDRDGFSPFPLVQLCWFYLGFSEFVD